MGSSSQTAERAIGVLLLIAESRDPISLADLSARAGLNKSATYRAARALMRHSLVARDGHRGYVTDSGLVTLAASVLRGVNVRELAQATMRRLNAETEETISLYVRDRRYRVCVAVAEALQPMRWVVEVGDRQPLHVGLTGKAILAFRPQPEIDEILDWAEHDGVDRKKIVRLLERMRSDGYLAEVGDRVPGVTGLSVPIFDSSGVAAALTISGPSHRFSKKVAEGTANAVLRETAAISAALGSPPTGFAQPSVVD